MSRAGVQRPVFGRLTATALRAAAGALSPAGARARLSILIYHRVLAGPDPLRPDEIEAHGFDRQVQALATVFNVLPLDEAVDRLHAGRLPARAACITFDDGYADNYEVALPILRARGLTATFFIATGYLDGGHMWNDKVIEAVRAAVGPSFDLSELGFGRFGIETIERRRAAARALIAGLKYLDGPQRERRASDIANRAGAKLEAGSMMSVAQVRALRRAGMGIGGHTVSHPILSGLDREGARAEMAKGKAALEAALGEPVRLFAYPNGKPGQDYTAEHVRLAQEEGFTAAVSTAWGTASAGADLHQLPRFTPWDRRSLPFAVRLLDNLRRPVAALA